MQMILTLWRWTFPARICGSQPTAEIFSVVEVVGRRKGHLDEFDMNLRAPHSRLPSLCLPPHTHTT